MYLGAGDSGGLNRHSYPRHKPSMKIALVLSRYDEILGSLITEERELTMISLCLSFAMLLVGYLAYGKLVDKIFGSDDRVTPANSMNDGVDFVPMKTWRAMLIQLLNIAGPGPIFGALMGACFGPVVFLWIVFGSILAGAVHDYMSGMISIRNDGASIAQLSGMYLGKPVLYGMRAFTLLLLVLAGTVLVVSPAALLTMLMPGFLSTQVWVIIILVYYVLATLLPIDRLIGPLYPVFGVLLLAMALGIGAVLLLNSDYQLPAFTLANLHPERLPVWPYLFVTVACGAISGFHATQSPMMAKCITSEHAGRKVFYGAMILEAAIALIWAGAGMAFYGGELNQNLARLGQSGTVYELSQTMLGKVGGTLAVVAVIICPITSGDTAFRSARLILSEMFHLNQKPIRNRLVITLPLLAVAAVLTQLDFNVLWRYFSWSNQTLAMISLWVATAYLLKTHADKRMSLVTALPATFMSAVSLTYILMANEGFRLPSAIAYPAGVVFAVALFGAYLYVSRKKAI